MFFARRPPYKDFMWYTCPSCLEKMGTPSYTTRADVTGEKTTTTDRGGYVIGLGVNYYSRGRANVGSGDEQSEATTTKTASGVCPSEAASEEPATEKASEESASETPTEEPTTHKPTDETASHLPK